MWMPVRSLVGLGGTPVVKIAIYYIYYHVLYQAKHQNSQRECD